MRIAPRFPRRCFDPWSPPPRQLPPSPAGALKGREETNKSKALWWGFPPRIGAHPCAHLGELWVYPVKACRGVKVKSARVTNTGFELDRAFCVVDTKGNVVWKGEAISQRALPVLAPPSMWR